MTPVHITKRALAVVGGSTDAAETFRCLCGAPWDGLGLGEAVTTGVWVADRGSLDDVTCPACLALLNAELEAERIATATDDELLAEAVGRGEDPEATRKRVQDLLREAVAKHRAEIEAGR